MTQLAVGLLIGLVVGGVVVGLAGRRAGRHRLANVQRSLDRATEDLLEAERDSVRRGQAQDLILNAMQEGVLLFDPAGAAVFANEALPRHLGVAPATVDRLAPSSLRDAVRRAGFVGSAMVAEVELGAPTRWLRATAQPVGTDGTVLMVVRDVTEARRLDAIRRDFVSNASHELKTPVASIRAVAETLGDGALQDPTVAGRFIEQLERDADRLGRIVADLLDLSRLETGSDRIARVAVDTLAEDEVTRRSEAAGAAGVSLDVQVDGVPAIQGSARDIALLLGNLIDNAISYTQPGGSVTVEVRAEVDAVIVRISDTGIGIPQRELPRIFERFYRVDRARSRDTGGTGLGLSIVRHVTENHGGEVSVTSELGHGSVFEVRLPTGPAAP
jgi:two-component system, OmpR family, phosphate regulon sensor histidine kinase PhoR